MAENKADISQTTIDEASEAQIRDYLERFLNIDVPEDADHAQLVSLVERAQPNNRLIFVLTGQDSLQDEQQPAGPSEDGNAGAQMGTLGRNDPRWEINIPIVDTEDNSGKNDVLVGVNGRAWQIKRGVDVSVPHRVVEALRNAVADIIRHDDEGNIQSRRAERFPFHVVSRPSQDEIDAWLERTGAEFCA